MVYTWNKYNIICQIYFNKKALVFLKKLGLVKMTDKRK